MGSCTGTMHTFKILLLLSALCWESHTTISPEVGEKIAQFQTNYEDSEVRERRDADPGYLLDKIVCKLLKCHKKSFGKLYEKPYERPHKSYDHGYYKPHNYKKRKNNSPGLYKSHGYKKHHFGRGNPVLKGGLEVDL